ncbi:Atg20 protein [Starmerella bacillaris]|uniref:Atg20 protein n=1 Tax=Starmerella bacillaris TaxID=1247836 RepID=A0AAV5RM64_STABA|nr:Atg20 protein [Starmerella bacillaris]
MDFFEDNNPLGVSDEQVPRKLVDSSPPPSNAPPQQQQQQQRQQIVITEATKVRDSASRGHVSYTIKSGSQQTVRRRYSEFESLQKLLRQLYPCVVVPPIPEKHSIRAYATNPTRAQDDIRTIQIRKRALVEFLTKCLSTPQICDSWPLSKFLDPNVNWKEVIESETVQNLPVSPLQSPPTNVSAENLSPYHAYLPIPPSTASIKGRLVGDSKKKAAQDDFSKFEESAEEYENAIGGGLDKRARRVTKHYSALLSEYADLGGQLNSFSLDSHNQFDKLAPAVEKVGQAMDQGYVLTSLLTDKLGIVFNEPLSESVRMAATAREVLRYRRQREIQVAIVQDILEEQKRKLGHMQQVESEANRMNSFLGIDERIGAATESLPGYQSRSHSNLNSEGAHVSEADQEHQEHQEHQEQQEHQEHQDNEDHDVDQQDSQDSQDSQDTQDHNDSSHTTTKVRTNSSGSSHSKSDHKGFRLPGIPLPGLGHINSAISGLMDSDPQTTRRNVITRTQELLERYEEVLKVAENDADIANEEVRSEIIRYQNSRQSDVKQLVKAFVRCHKEWAEKNLESWVEAKQAIESS